MYSLPAAETGVRESKGIALRTTEALRSVIFVCAVLVAVTVAVYWQIGDHEFLSYDDPVYVTENKHVTNGITRDSIIWALTSFYGSNWHPLTWLSHMVDVQFYGMHPRGHHLTNLAIHTISTVVLFLFLLRFTGALWSSSFVAALFALHPMHVESVAWVAERKDVLSALLWFLTLFLYCEYARKPTPARYILCLIFFILGLMAKPMLVTLPVVMFLMDFWPLGRHRNKGQGAARGAPSGKRPELMPLLKEKIPFFACALLSSVATILAQNSGGSVKTLGEIPFQFRIENALIAYVKYVGKSFWPGDLAALYPIPLSFPLWQSIGSLLLLILVSAAAVRVRRRYPYVTVGWLWFLVTLLPVIGLIQVGVQSMADRYSYVPSIGLFIIVAWWVPELAKGLRWREAVLSLLAGAVTIGSAALTWQQLGYWRDSMSLYRHTLRITSGNYVMHTNLGDILGSKGEFDAAIREFEEALRIRPGFWPARYNLSHAHFHAGMAQARKGALDAAIRELQEAVRINPNNSQAHYNLRALALKKQQLEARR